MEAKTRPIDYLLFFVDPKQIELNLEDKLT